VFGFATFFLLPNEPENAYFLNEHDKENMEIRAQQTRIYTGEDKFEWRHVRSAFTEFKLYIRFDFLKHRLTISAFCQFGADVCLYGFSTFLPIIIQAMGYDAVEAQYLTIPGIILKEYFNFSLSLGRYCLFYHCMVVRSY
jgi:hypothetical protein